MSEQSTSLLDRAFAVIIAFLLPGLIALFGISTVNDTVQRWFQGAQSGPTIAGLVFVLFAALALNIVITAIRWAIFEGLRFKWLAWLGCPWVRPAPRFSHAQRVGKEAQYVDMRHQHYYHYLAYANASVALPLAFAAWKIGSAPEPPWSLFWLVLGVTAIASPSLAWAGCDAVHRYDERRKELLGEPLPQLSTDSAATSS